ncbi:MAG: porin [Prevotella sp.]
MKKNFLFALFFTVCFCVDATAQKSDSIVYKTEIHGVIRGKYEYQPEDKAGRFQVRSARVSLEGKVTPIVAYKAEVDLSDEGTIKMLDAYTSISPSEQLRFTIGQMRVPFTIDAHRSPDKQYFANRSFIAKQVANVRDVGLTAGYDFVAGIPMRIEAGIFNGSGITNQQDFWTKQINYSTKLQAFIPGGWNITLSAQKIKPDHHTIMMYDAGMFYHAHGLHAEVEYLIKHYADNVFQNVHALDAFMSYDIPLKNCMFTKVSPLVRYDYMGDHSDGYRYLNGVVNDAGSLIINDHKRSRITTGATFSFNKPFISDIRLNYEKYFYENDAFAKPSEKTKFVIEVMTKF